MASKVPHYDAALQAARTHAADISASAASRFHKVKGSQTLTTNVDGKMLDSQGNVLKRREVPSIRGNAPKLRK
jgi:hypothetical protein